MVYEIVILAMIAAFLGLRLYSVLGQRSEHEEEQPIPTRFDRSEPEAQELPREREPQPMPPRPFGNDDALPAVERGVREIAATDRNFDILAFLEGAKGAYGMVLEAFWKGDKETLRELCDDDVFAGFEAAIDAREEAGETLDNRLVRIEEAKIHSASLDGSIARISVLFVSDIAAVTRDKDENVIAGSLDDAIESRDIWTFSRDINSAGPDWILDETDEG